MMITITIQRQKKNNKCVMGTMKATSDKKEGVIEGYTLEPPDLGNKRNVSCIPAGEYEAYIRDKNTSKWDYDCLQLVDVPNRTDIQLHAGNYPKNTVGCILVGSLQGHNAVWKSKDKLKELVNFCRGEEIRVIIKEGA